MSAGGETTSNSGRAPTGFERLPGPPGTRFAEVRRFAEIDSTNRYLLDVARAGAPEGTVVVADHQSAGRGRLDRRWEAPAGDNLLVSVLLRPSLPLGELHLCSAAVALAAADACGRVAGLMPDLKWPNDLVVGERKLGGILAEVVPNAPTGSVGSGAPGASGGPAELGVVVGLGLNVRWPPPHDANYDGNHPERHAPVGSQEPARRSDVDELLRSATSILKETGRALEPVAVLLEVLWLLDGRITQLTRRDGRHALASEYRRRCVTVGRTVRVSVADESFSGTAVDITPEGHLVVDVGACFRTVSAGDVVHVRVAG
jgi:BirA family transcriptional regulator, biotin operon repressor / biotin---[acetyl-CoA-carboxylase] ligase